MDNNLSSILGTFGGLPPFAFELQPDDNLMPEIDSLNNWQLDLSEYTAGCSTAWPNTFDLNNGSLVATEGLPLWDSQADANWSASSTAVTNSGKSTPATSTESSPATLEFRSEDKAQCRRPSMDEKYPQHVQQPRRKQPSAQAKEILEAALRLELYPDKKETERLAERAQMTFQQVRDWFRNQRRRRPTEELQKLQAKGSASSVALTHRSLEVLEATTHPPVSGYNSALRRSQSVASLSAHRPALRRSQSVASFQSHRSRASGKSRHSGASGKSHQSGRSRASGNSAQSGRTVVSNTSKVSKRSTGRKGKRIVEVSSKLVSPKQPYRCTFCWKGFATKFSWKRHEESVHLQAKAWTCTMPDISEQIQSGFALCPYCSSAFGDSQLMDPTYLIHRKNEYEHRSPDFHCRYCYNQALALRFDGLRQNFEALLRFHMDGHESEACNSRRKEERTFYRKEHIVQHLVNVHGVKREFLVGGKLSDFVVETFDLPLDHPGMNCPFCLKKFRDWGSRIDHVANHFVGENTVGHQEVRSAKALSKLWMDAYTRTKEQRTEDDTTLDDTQ